MEVEEVILDDTDEADVVTVEEDSSEEEEVKILLEKSPAGPAPADAVQTGLEPANVGHVTWGWGWGSG